MAFLLMARAIKSEIPDCYAKWLMVVLADHADEDKHLCWPSLSRLSQRTAMSVATVTRKLHWLEDHGYLTRERGHTGKSTRYIIFPKDVAHCNKPIADSNTPVADSNTNLSITNKEPKKQKGQVPDDWFPSDDLCKSIDAKHKENIDHVTQADKFINYHQATGKKFASFDRAYRYWCSNHIEWRANASRSGSNAASKQSSQGRQAASHFARMHNRLQGSRD